MAAINIFVPRVAADRFTGGLLCIFQYANGLAERGHAVTVIPTWPSEDPRWIERKFKMHHLRFDGVGRDRLRYYLSPAREGKKRALSRMLVRRARRGGYTFNRASQIEWLRDQAFPAADISIATHYSTALITYLHGTGRKFYFLQHYEPVFASETEYPELAEIDAYTSYALPLEIIANSSWLAGRIREAHRRDVPVCPNAIDARAFFPQRTRNDGPFTVLSYGGRNSQWKGLRDAAEAIRRIRKTIPDLEWQVFGDALLPPQNDIASYKPLGFITGNALRHAYSNADVVLCPSWYESFPLYPLEAMACGSAVITTPYGTEDFAVHMHNAWVTPPKDAASMAEAVEGLYRDAALRKRIAGQGAVDAPAFTWEKSIRRMMELIGVGDARP